jgi:hypothetical protein
MRKLVLALAALAVLGTAMPYAALADEVVIHRHRGHEFMPPPVHHHDKTVIIKHGDE